MTDIHRLFNTLQYFSWTYCYSWCLTLHYIWATLNLEWLSVAHFTLYCKCTVLQYSSNSSELCWVWMTIAQCSSWICTMHILHCTFSEVRTGMTVAYDAFPGHAKIQQHCTVLGIPATAVKFEWLLHISHRIASTLATTVKFVEFEWLLLMMPFHISHCVTFQQH